MTATPIDHFISGHKVSGSAARAQDVFNPATGAVTGRVMLIKPSPPPKLRFQHGLTRRLCAEPA
jgi:hypothetical protein